MPIKLENASKRTGNRWLYRDVSFEVADGEIFGIFGPNGSGKRDILQSFGDPFNSKSSLFTRLFANGSDAGNFARIVDYVGSKGGQIVLPELFNGFDRGQKTRLIELLRSAASENRRPVLVSTTDFDDVLEVCDRAAALADGYIQQIATPRELYAEPENRIVAAMTGRVNLIEARRLSSSKSEMPEFQTIMGEHRLFTQKVELRTLGAINKNAYLAIRPEQIVLSFGASFPEDNLLKAVISGIEFHGPVTYVRLDCSGLELEAMVTRLIGLNIGDECMVGLPPDRIRVLAD